MTPCNRVDRVGTAVQRGILPLSQNRRGLSCEREAYKAERDRGAGVVLTFLATRLFTPACQLASITTNTGAIPYRPIGLLSTAQCHKEEDNANFCLFFRPTHEDYQP